MRVLITLRAEDAELTRLQAVADEFAHECALPDDERWRLLIILEELFTNAVTHGAGLRAPAGRITVVLGWRRCRMRISFIDDGPPFDPLAFHEPGLAEAAEDRTIGGLGIHIVRRLVHQARYRREGGCNRLHLVRRIGSLETAG
jgi:serine/threonine-protein kinase RsbW